jgi:erythromycin esterase
MHTSTILRHFVPLLLLLNLSTACAQKTTQELTWLKKNAIPLESVAGETFSDLAFLKNKLQGVRLVQLGESSHGIAEFYQLKSRLVQYLHREMGFEVLVMEGGFGDINIAWLQRDEFSAKDLMYQTLFGNFRCEEMLPLFEYLKKQGPGPRPLVLAGSDCQASSSFFNNFLIDLTEKYDPELGRDVSYNFQNTFMLYGLMQDSAQLMQAIDKNAQLIEKVNLFLDKNAPKIRKDYPNKPQLIPFIRRTLENYLEYWSLGYPEMRKRYQFPLRDRIMAENLQWLAEVAYPGKKIIYWAHNAHISAEKPLPNYPKMQGNYVRERFGKEAYAIGLYAAGGETYRHWMRDVSPFKDDAPGSLGGRFAALSKDVHFLDLRNQKNGTGTQWLFNPLAAFELENGGQIKIVPAQRFDALLVLRKVKSPKYFD